MRSQKKKTLTEYLKLNVKVLNTLSWVRYKYLQSEFIYLVMMIH